MTTNLIRRGLSVSVRSDCLLSFVGKRREFDHKLDITARRITVETDSGDMTVTRTDADRVRLHGIKETVSVFTDIEDMTVETIRNGSHFRISPDSETESFLGLGGGTVFLDVRVLEDLAVERVATKNGDITVIEVAGDATLKPQSEMMARNIDGYVSLGSTNDAGRARDIAGIDGAEVTNGEIDIDISAALVPDLNATVTASATNDE